LSKNKAVITKSIGFKMQDLRLKTSVSHIMWIGWIFFYLKLIAKKIPCGLKI